MASHPPMMHAGVTHYVLRNAVDAGARPAPALRLGLRSIRGLGAAAKAAFERAHAEGPFTSIEDFVRRTRLDRRALRTIAEAGALDALVPDEPDVHRRRRVALWRVLAAERGDAGPLAPSRESVAPLPLPALLPFELTASDYRLTGISLAGHPMRHLRSTLAPNGIRSAAELLARGRDGERVGFAGLVICRQRPGTAKGFVFLSLEDETGILNVVVTPQRFEREALLISTQPLLLVRGRLQVEESVVNLRAESFAALEAPVGAEHARSHDFR